MTESTMKPNLLLVDDEEGIRKVLGISLTDMGYRVDTAESGEKALKLFRELSPPVVLTDIKMPGMDGIELLQQIKAENPDTEVIMITGHGDMKLAIKSLKLEAVDFITKPIDDDALEIALKRALDKIDMRRRLREHTENLETLVQEQSKKLVEMERQGAVGQAIEGFSSAMKNIADGFNGDLRYVNELPCYVSVHNSDLKVVAANDLYRSRLGSSEGDDSWKVFAGDTADKETCPVGETVRSAQGRRQKTEVRDREGTLIPVMVYTAPILNRDGKVELVLEIAADMLEVKNIQEELRTTQRKYRQLFDEVPCYIAVIDRDFHLTETNKLFKKDFGEQSGSFCFDLFKNRDKRCSDCPVVKTFEDGTSHHTETVVMSRNKEQFNVLIWTAPIRNVKGDITHVMEMATNITEIRQLQDHLASLGLKIGSISHGIKGLLTGLDGGMYIVESGFKKDNIDKIKEGWEMVRLMAERIRKLILDILYFAKDRELNWEWTDAANLVKEVTAIVEPKVRDKNIEIVTDIEASMKKIEIDPGVVSSALVNVLENAVDACISDRAKDEHRIDFKVRPDGEHILFEIADNGIGMDETTQENLFTLFYSSKGDKGTGLGLFVANRIVGQHGGSITIDSEPGRGSRFRIRLPKNRKAKEKLENT